MRNYLVLGDWNVICDRCGFEFKASKLRKEWTGLMVCGSCWEARHPQDLIRVPREDVAPPWTRPEAPDTFIRSPYILLTEDAADILTENDLPLLIE